MNWLSIDIYFICLLTAKLNFFIDMKWRDIDPQTSQCGASQKETVLGGKGSSECTRKEFPPIRCQCNLSVQRPRATRGLRLSTLYTM